MRKDKKEFIIKSSIYFLIIVILLISINFVYVKKVLTQTNVYKSEKQFEKENINNLRIIFFGDSQPAFSVNPEFIENSFNYSMPSETYEQTYYKIKKILEGDNQIEKIVIPFDLHSFNDYRVNPYTDIWYWANFLNYTELSTASEKSIPAVFFSRYFPVIGKGKFFMRLMKKEESTYMYKGWQRHNDEMDVPKNSTLTASSAIKEYISEEDEINKKLFNSFISILDLAQKKGIEVVLLKYPITESHYDSLISMGRNPESYYDYLNSVVSGYDNVEVFDYQLKYKDDYNFFLNSNHMNYLGAEIFSKDLRSKLKRFSVDEE